MRKNSICIDGYNLALPKGTGIATYGKNLLENVARLGFGTEVLYGPPGHVGQDAILNEASLVDVAAPAGKLNRKAKAIRFRKTFLSRFGRELTPITPTGEVVWPGKSGGLPPANRFWAAQNLFHYANRSFRAYGASTPVTFASASDQPPPAVMHWSTLLPIHARNVPNIYTIHDLIPLKLPYTTLDLAPDFMKLCRRVLDRADHIATVSETTRQDLIRIFGVPEDRVTNTYQSVSLPAGAVSRSRDEVEIELDGVFGLEWKGYFLHFGAVEPKKNLGRVVEAYLASGVLTPLVIVGGSGWLEAGEIALLREVKQRGGASADRILEYNYLPLGMLISLIRGAKAVVFPSLYEGFGLPVLEAMSLSTAVLTSTGGALPEVAGESAIIVDPYDVEDIKRGFRTLDADDDYRIALEEAGRRRAALFTPEAYRARLSDLYRKVGVDSGSADDVSTAISSGS